MRDAKDRCLIAVGHHPFGAAGNLKNKFVADVPGFRVTDMTVGEWANLKPDVPEYFWYRDLLIQADRIVRHRLSFFDRDDCDLGHPIDWNRDHKSGKKSPMRFAPSIDYRDFKVTGDCKFVWEPNRHHQLVVLARAYRSSGDNRYARAIVDQLQSWLDQCPFGIGMNWRSPLELGIRLINWVWAIDLIHESRVIDGDLRLRLIQSVGLHLHEITRKYSRGSSVNNHTIGEAAGVFIAASYFWRLPDALRWQHQSCEILCRTIMQQTYPDGGTREQALGYHLFVLQFYLLVGIVARHIAVELPRYFWTRLETMLEFAGVLSEGGDRLPMFGDCDDGYVLDLGGPRGEVRSLLAVGAVLFDRSDFKTWAKQYSQPARWLLGCEGRKRFDALDSLGVSTQIVSRSLPESGYFLIQCGNRDSDDRISVVFDCGELGLEPLAGHGHADALSFTLRAFGKDVLVDPGTYDYFSYPEWRSYFRSTRAHNTVVIDGQNQSVMLGPFLWGRRADSELIRWQPDAMGGIIVARHNGYARLDDPVVHCRTLQLDGRTRKITVRDEILCRDSHQVTIYFHLAEDCRIMGGVDNRYRIDAGPGPVLLSFDPRLTIRLLSAGENPIGGWVSRGYHRKSPATTFAASGSFTGSITLICEIQVGEIWGL